MVNEENTLRLSVSAHASVNIFTNRDFFKSMLPF